MGWPHICFGVILGPLKENCMEKYTWHTNTQTDTCQLKTIPHCNWAFKLANFNFKDMTSHEFFFFSISPAMARLLSWQNTDLIKTLLETVGEWAPRISIWQISCTDVMVRVSSQVSDGNERNEYNFEYIRVWHCYIVCNFETCLETVERQVKLRLRK